MFSVRALLIEPRLTPECDITIWFQSQQQIEMGKVDKDSTYSYLFMFSCPLFCIAQ